MKLENCVVRKWDIIYCELLKLILNEGEETENRTGVNAIRIGPFSFTLNLADEFPILETKKVGVKNATSEIQWIHQVQSNDVRWLHERNNTIWDQWMIDKDGIYREYEPEGSVYDKEKTVTLVDINGKPLLKDRKPYQVEGLIEGKTIKSAKYYGEKWAYTIGASYGWRNKRYQQSQDVNHKLIYTPNDRRINIDLNQKAHDKEAVLPPCVWSVEFTVYKGTLNCCVHQRSADVPVGLPFNVTQYAILLAMFAKSAGLEPGVIEYSIAQPHIYVNQLEGIKTQLRRYEKMLDIEKEAKHNQVFEKYNDLANKIAYIKMHAKNAEQLKEVATLEDDLKLYKLMLEKEKPVIQLANKDFFDFSTDFSNDKEYLKENATGNEDIKLLKYKSAPFIKLSVAQ